MGEYAEDAYERDLDEYFYEKDHPEEFDGERCSSSASFLKC